jgi:hypothetical protein
MSEQQPDGSERTPEQEANIQRHLRRQKQMRRKEGQPGKKVARAAAVGCGTVSTIGLIAAAGFLYLAFWFLGSMSG